jgi:hypothetical protein
LILKERLDIKTKIKIKKIVPAGPLTGLDPAPVIDSSQ